MRSRAATTGRSARTVRFSASLSVSSSTSSWATRWRTTIRSTWGRRSLWVPVRRRTMLDDAPGVAPRERDPLALPQHGNDGGQAPLPVADGLGQHPGHAGVALEASGGGLVRPRTGVGTRSAGVARLTVSSPRAGRTCSM